MLSEQRPGWSQTLEFGPTDNHMRALCVAPEEGADWRHINNGDLTEYEKERLGFYLKELGVFRAYAPFAPAMSARIADPCALQDELIALPGGIQLYRSHTEADGLRLDEPGIAAIFAPGGCGVILAEHVVAHAGRESLIDRQGLCDGVPSRPHFSIVDAVAERLRRAGVRIEDTPFHFLFPLPASEFTHPADEYRAYLRYGRGLGSLIAWEQEDGIHLDIGRLALAQAREEGFAADRAPRCVLPVWGVHGYTRHPNEALRTHRNLVIVVREA